MHNFSNANRNAIAKCVEETETGSDGDGEEIDSPDLSDAKTSKALGTLVFDFFKMLSLHCLKYQ